MLQEFRVCKPLYNKEEPGFRLRADESPLILKRKLDRIARPAEPITDQPDEIVGLFLRRRKNASFDDRLTVGDGEEEGILANARLSTNGVAEDSSIPPQTGE
jgi:hypothetical protein